MRSASYKMVWIDERDRDFDRDFDSKLDCNFCLLMFPLSPVSGNVKSGQLVAILGASGAGKTTLLAGISQRFRGPITGRLSLNGNTIDSKSMAKMSCFVPQFDIAFDTLTPNEHMYFMSELKLDRKWTTQQKRERIDFLLREVGLMAVADNRIRTMSGGERKRLTIATDVSKKHLCSL